MIKLTESSKLRKYYLIFNFNSLPFKIMENMTYTFCQDIKNQLYPCILNINESTKNLINNH